MMINSDEVMKVVAQEASVFANKTDEEYEEFMQEGKDAPFKVLMFDLQQLFNREGK